ncbi:MAG: hypothetical protein AAFX04_09875 [Pseudomonadota bacterium]
MHSELLKFARGRHVSFALATILGIAVCPLSAAAQEQDSEEQAATASDSRITVDGQPRTRAEERAEIVEYVRSAGVANGLTPAARWLDPICPVAFGISAEHAAIVIGHIRDVAMQVGAPVAREGCPPNISVIFSTDGSDTASQIRRKKGRQFAEVPLGERKAMFDGDAPIRWWYRTQARAIGGERPTFGDPIFVTAEGDGSNIGNNLGNAPTLQQYRPSLISSNTGRAIIAASVVIDVNAAHGYTLDSVSQYAAMVVLAEMRADAGPYGDSIMNLFDPAHGYDHISGRDEAFLTKLYDLPLDRSSRTQRSMLVRALLEESSGSADN